MRGQITLANDTPAETVDAFLRDLKRQLLRLRPVTLDAQTSEITVRGGFFRLALNWNLLVPITSATIRATSSAHEVLVTYDIRLTQLFRVCTFLSLSCLVVTLFVIGSVAFGLGAELSDAVAFGLGTQFAIWGWLFGMNYITTRFRFRRLLQRILRSDLVGS